MKATFATFDLGYKNLLKIERPTSAKCHFTNQKNRNKKNIKKLRLVRMIKLASTLLWMELNCMHISSSNRCYKFIAIFAGGGYPLFVII